MLVHKNTPCAEAYLETCRISTMEFFCEDSSTFLSANYFCKNTPFYMFDWVLNTPMLWASSNSHLINKLDKPNFHGYCSGVLFDFELVFISYYGRDQLFAHWETAQ